MQRIPSIDPSKVSAKVNETLEAVKKKIGMVPNLFKVFAQSEAVLNAYLGQSEALSHVSLSAQLREQLAVAIAGINSCDYCASAHTLMGKGTGVSEAELKSNLEGSSADAKTQAALTFARKVVEARGQLADSDLHAVRAAGYSNAEIVEIIALVGLNLFTNYTNHIAATEIDFPHVSTSSARKAA